ncbi:MAG: YeiH family protein [Gammaproteobacteria bacterium]|nr:YeiH family protein [Gammaproteobacteria bacterium]
MAQVNRKWTDGMLTTEDWWACWVGLLMFAAATLTIWGVEIVGWQAKPGTWAWGDFSWAKAIKPAGKAWKGLGPIGSLITTYVVWTIVMCIGAYSMKLDVRKFFIGWTIIFVITWAVWIIGREAHLAATTNKWDKYGITWGLSLGGGASFIMALAVGLIIGNVFKGLAAFLRDAAKPEWYIKTAIVYLGIKLGLISMKSAGYAVDLLIAGMAATFVAYMFFWPIVYALARKAFRLRRDVSAILGSGISICGVSASMATAGAIRARPFIPVAVSMLIVIFAMIELIVLPIFYANVAPNQPIVNGAAMGMTVKTDGADAAAGAILEELMRAAHESRTGEKWGEGILVAAIVTKIWIDVFIGVWAFVLALIWVYKVEKRPGEAAVGAMEIWFRFPKFVIGYFIAWFFYLGLAFLAPAAIKAASVGAGIVQSSSSMRGMMFMLTFTAIGIITDFSKLKGMGKLALLYGIALFVVIAPIAYVVAWIFHRGMMPLPG